MPTLPATRPQPNGPRKAAVHGLDAGRHRGRRQAARRRFANTVVALTVFAIVGSVLGGAGYLLWQFYGDEQERTVVDQPTPSRSAEEVIEVLEDQPRWNGPGSPAFGVGGEAEQGG